MNTRPSRKEGDKSPAAVNRYPSLMAGHDPVFPPRCLPLQWAAVCNGADSPARDETESVAP